MRSYCYIQINTKLIKTTAYLNDLPVLTACIKTSVIGVNVFVDNIPINNVWYPF